MTTRLLRFAAFTDDPAGGNPAGVHLSDTLPDPVDMQRTAAEVGFSETAFLAQSPVDPNRFEVRYFSPAAEVDFCGHATIASGVCLAGQFGVGAFVLDSNVGEVPVVTDDAGGQVRATLTSAPPSLGALQPPLLGQLLDLFGWSPTDLDARHPPAVAWAGVHHPILVLSDRDVLADMSYPFEDLRRLMAAEAWTTVQIVCQTGPEEFAARNPFPVGGVVEDPATGAAAAALGGYLREMALITPPGNLTIIQGEDMGRRSVISVHVPSGQGGIEVSGTAVSLDH